MILIEQLTKRYGAHTAVDSVSFAVHPGTVTGFLGPNGAGKSTTLRMLVGLTPPSSGTSSVLGVPYASLPNPGRRSGCCSTPRRNIPAAPAGRCCPSEQH